MAVHCGTAGYWGTASNCSSRPVTADHRRSREVTENHRSARCLEFQEAGAHLLERHAGLGVMVGEREKEATSVRKRGRAEI